MKHPYRLLLSFIATASIIAGCSSPKTETPQPTPQPTTPPVTQAPPPISATPYPLGHSFASPNGGQYIPP